MTSYKRDGTVGPWAHEKLACLEKYLSAYTTILRKQASWCRGYFYIDAFAGAGRAKLRKTAASTGKHEAGLFADAWREDVGPEEAEYVNGSPRRALSIQWPFTHYFFIEQNLDRIDALRLLKTEYGATREISILESDANDALRKNFLSGRIDWKHHRGVVFLDPFGLQMPWKTIEQIAETEALEVIVNLPVGTAIQRLLPRSGEISVEQRAMLSGYFGTDEWEEVVYTRSPDLFGDERANKVGESGDDLARWYQRRLTNLFGYGARPRLIRNSQGGHLYYLLFAGPNAKGAEIAGHVLSQGEVVK